MKKKVAVFATGWGKEILAEYMKGLEDGFKSSSTDLFLFVSYPLLDSNNHEEIEGNLNIYNLPDLSDFDGAAIFGNGFDFPNMFESICQKVKEAGIPAVSTGRKSDDLFFVGSNNYKGMVDLCRYVVEERGITDIMYVAGSAQNPDSNIRLKAIQDVLRENGKELKEEDIFYTDWNTYMLKEYLDEQLQSGKPLRKAYICANDPLALAVAEVFFKHKVEIPTQSIITGFDDTYYARIYYPSIASVSQNFLGVGIESAKILNKAFLGEEVQKETYIDSSFRPSESCGAVADAALAEERKMLGRTVQENEVTEFDLSQKLNRLDATVLGCRNVLKLSDILCGFYVGYSGFEKGNFHLVIDPEFEKTIYTDLSTLKKEGYAKSMKVLVSVHDGQISSLEHFPTSKLVPFRDESEDSDNHTYILMPLFINGMSIGYVVFRDICKELDRNHGLQNYQNRLVSIFDKFRQGVIMDYLNKQLLLLNETDSLTRVKNRKAYENTMLDINDAILLGEDVKFAICMFDVNNLKTINDELGHEAGDAYIVNSSKLICHIYKHSPVFRIGGDEFLVLLRGNDYKERNVLLENMRNYMEDIKEMMVPPTEKISIASGMAEYNPLLDKELADVTRRADAMMYQNKTEMKKKN